jgi:hypothetical protein
MIERENSNGNEKGCKEGCKETGKEDRQEEVVSLPTLMKGDAKSSPLVFGGNFGPCGEVRKARRAVCGSS